MSICTSEILYLFKEGNKNAFEQIYRIYISRVYRFISVLIQDENITQDLAQDVFVHIWNKRGNIEVDNNFEGYLFKVTRTIVYQYIRRQVLLDNYLNQLTQGDIQETNDDLFDKIDKGLLEKKILELLNKLPVARRKVFMLYWKGSKNYSEIATQLNISEKTVATQIRRTLFFLREQLSQYSYMLFIAMFLS